MRVRLPTSAEMNRREVSLAGHIGRRRAPAMPSRGAERRNNAIHRIPGSKSRNIDERANWGVGRRDDTTRRHRATTFPIATRESGNSQDAIQRMTFRYAVSVADGSFAMNDSRWSEVASRMRREMSEELFLLGERDRRRSPFRVESKRQSS